MNIKSSDFLNLSLKMHELAKRKDYLTKRYESQRRTMNDDDRKDMTETMDKLNDDIEKTQSNLNRVIDQISKRRAMAASVIHRNISENRVDLQEGQTSKTAKVYTLYHGSKKDIKPEELEERLPPYSGSLGKGIYFGQNRETAEFYGKYVLEVKADLKNPLIIDAEEGINYRIAEEIREHYETTGSYDSILTGESIIPFDIKVGGKWHEIRDAWDLKDIGGLAKSAGHDALIVDGIRERSSVNEEVLIFDKKSLIFSETKKASLEKTYKHPTGKVFISMKKKTVLSRIVNSFLELQAGPGTDVQEAYRTKERQLLIQPKPPRVSKPADPNEPFAKAGEKVWMLNKDGEWVSLPWSNKLEEIQKSSC